MAQLFQRYSNFIAKASIIGILILIAGTAAVIWEINRSPWTTMAEVPRQQPVPFSHKHHVDGLGIDCRYCHTSVTQSAFAGIPPVQTCMTCHSQIWTNAALLAPIRDAYRGRTPIAWTRVHDLPDFVYFNHSIHIHQGIGCVSCHGRIDQMPITEQAETLHMRWCLSCHRDPAKFIRPRSEVFNMTYKPPVSQAVLGPELVKQYHILNVQKMTDCVTCHR